MNREEAEKVLNAIDFKDGDNIVIINKNVYDKMKNEKQQLISFLEEKIKNLKNYASSFGLTIDRDIRQEIDIKISAYKNVLDFVNKGDENE